MWFSIFCRSLPGVMAENLIFLSSVLGDLAIGKEDAGLIISLLLLAVTAFSHLPARVTSSCAAEMRARGSTRRPPSSCNVSLGNRHAICATDGTRQCPRIALRVTRCLRGGRRGLTNTSKRRSPKCRVRQLPVAPAQATGLLAFAYR